MLKNKVTLYKPSRTPWRATRSGTDRLVWYSVFDNEGHEIFKTGPVELRDEDQVKANLFLAMMTVNGNPTLTVDNNEVTVEWK